MPVQCQEVAVTNSYFPPGRRKLVDLRTMVEDATFDGTYVFDAEVGERSNTA